MKNGKLGAKKIAIIAAAVLAGVAAVFLFFFRPFHSEELQCIRA